MSNEISILRNLEKLCTSQGYIHALAALCFRDNFLSYQDELTASKVAENYSMNTLIRQEISLLTALMLKKPVDVIIPVGISVKKYMDETDSLLQQLHETINNTGLNKCIKNGEVIFNPLTVCETIRETIFYSGESAYDFQYTDFSKQKYKQDREWLVLNKGFSIDDGVKITEAILSLHSERASFTNVLSDILYDDFSCLPIFMFSIEEIHNNTAIDKKTIKNFIDAFSTLEVINEDFYTASDLNPVNIKPILKIDESNFLLFQFYSLAESLYESPFYWFLEDHSYKQIAEANRGKFTENFCFKMLCSVFGEKYVFKNVEIFESKQRIGEIDVLVLFAGRAIVLQAKSKRLTLSARKGNEIRLKEDFEKAVQAAYDQGLSCSKCLFNKRFRFVVNGKNNLDIKDIKISYIMCVVSDNYPSLSFQSRQFLRFETSTTIPSPLVIDIFSLDTICKMLSSPLQFLSYIDRRAKFSDNIIAASEIAVLSYHLQHNLWLNVENTMYNICEDYSSVVDVAMYSRRREPEKTNIPDGILTIYHGTVLGNILKQIESKPNREIIDFGLFVLEFSENTFVDLSNHIEKQSSLAISDGKNHNLSIVIGENNYGITIHFNSLPRIVALANLQRHCEVRKNLLGADKWFGLCLLPTDLSLRFGLTLDYQLKQNDSKCSASKSILLHRISQKIGRNDICPCGSGKKYKKCCLIKRHV